MLPECDTLCEGRKHIELEIFFNQIITVTDQLDLIKGVHLKQLSMSFLRNIMIRCYVFSILFFIITSLNSVFVPIVAKPNMW